MFLRLKQLLLKQLGFLAFELSFFALTALLILHISYESFDKQTFLVLGILYILSLTIICSEFLKKAYQTKPNT